MGSLDPDPDPGGQKLISLIFEVLDDKFFPTVLFRSSKPWIRIRIHEILIPDPVSMNPDRNSD
jgi:hypothetical protein